MKGEITIQEFKGILKYIIDNNEQLVAQNKPKVTVEILGGMGIGKTSAIEQIAKEKGMNFVKINLAQSEELGDIIGYPIKEYNIKNPQGESVWVNDKVLDTYLKIGYTLEPNTESRMSYAIPSWVPVDEHPTLLLLDDFRRADNRYIQAVMELLSRGEYISWKLPKNTHIVLSSNPDNGEYHVSSLDPAQRNRFISFNAKFDLDDWVKWAEEEELNSQIINFSLFYPEIFNEPEKTSITPRSMETFANAISGITDYSNPTNLALINSIAEGCFESEENTIGKFFTMFVNNKLDRLVTAKEILHGEWKSISAKLRNSVYEGDKFRADISSVLAMRFINYVDIYFKQPYANSQVVIDRVIELVGSEKVLLTEDIIFKLVRTLYNKYPQRINKLLLNPEIRKAIIG